jgi:hypothetical protein
MSNLTIHVSNLGIRRSNLTIHVSNSGIRRSNLTIRTSNLEIRRSYLDMVSLRGCQRQRGWSAQRAAQLWPRRRQVEAALR